MQRSVDAILHISLVIHALSLKMELKKGSTIINVSLLEKPILGLFNCLYTPTNTWSILIRFDTETSDALLQRQCKTKARVGLRVGSCLLTHLLCVCV